MVTVLVHEWVTGGGLAGAPLPPSWAAEGAAMRRALACEFASLADVRVIVTADARCAGGRSPWDVVAVDAGAEPRVFASLAARADYTLVIAPETNGVLAERARIVDRLGACSLGSTATAIALAGDKLRLAAELQRQGIATPPCRVVRPAEGLPSDHPYPAVLKPRDGAGAVDTYLVERADALPAAVRGLHCALLQPFVAGLPLSASFLVAADGTPRLLGVGRQRIVLDAGRFCYRGGELPSPRDWLAPDVVRAIAAVPGLRGFVGVDFVYDESTRRATIVEVNPRPTTSVVGLLHVLPAGRLARAWLGEDEELADLVHGRPPVRFDPDGTVRGVAGARYA